MEDYTEAIRRHRIVIDDNPGNALAHYHLGFAYGVVGKHRQELAEYQKAINLGLDDWQLFLNLGLLYLEDRPDARRDRGAAAGRAAGTGAARDAFQSRARL